MARKAPARRRRRSRPPAAPAPAPEDRPAPAPLLVLSHLALVEPPHAHAVCRQCGRILEVPLGALDIAQLTSLAGAAAEEWSVERISLSLNGLCPRCRHGALPPSLGPRE